MGGTTLKRVIIGIFVTIVVVILVLGGVGQFTYSIFSSSEFDINFENKTDSQIQNLKITYTNITKDIDVPMIQPNSSIKISVNPTEEFGENRMILYYFDNQKRRNEEILVGYFERGYSGSAKVKILNIDSEGKLNIKVE